MNNRSVELVHVSFARHDNVDVKGRHRRCYSIESVVDTIRIVMKEHEFAHLGTSGQRHGVLDGRMSEVTHRREFVEGVLGIVQQKIGPATEFEGCAMYGAESVITIAPFDGTVVGHVRHSRVVRPDPVPERATSFVRDLLCQHVESLDLVTPGLEGVKRPCAAKTGRTDGKMRRTHHLLKNGLCVTLPREMKVDAGVRTVTGAEERQPVNVIPMKMGKKDRTIERMVTQHVAETREAASGIEDQRGSGAVVGK